jgi:hypothetical protein
MDNIGVAPFFDVGGAFVGSLPFSGGGDTRMSAGVGLLYYTPIGPIRVDVARPLDPRRATIRSSSTSALDNRSDGQLPLLPPRALALAAALLAFSDSGFSRRKFRGR